MTVVQPQTPDPEGTARAAWRPPSLIRRLCHLRISDPQDSGFPPTITTMQHLVQGTLPSSELNSKQTVALHAP